MDEASWAGKSGLSPAWAEVLAGQAGAIFPASPLCLCGLFLKFM